MKIAYFDCFSGISGDMTLGALIDLGVPLQAIQAGIASMGLTEVKVSADVIKKAGFRAVQVKIEHPPEHAHRHLHHIEEMIDRGDAISAPAKQLAKTIFGLIGEAEAKMHNTTIRKVHFHEVGAIDSIADIVGAAIGFTHLGIEQFSASPVPTGCGSIEIAHGKVSIPAPATAELLCGVPIAACDIARELTTPTGAAIIKATCRSFGPMPAMTMHSVGYGSGTYDLPSQANLLRIVVGEAQSSDVNEALRPVYEHDQVVVLETNIDDSTAEELADCVRRLFESGALDVFQVPCFMKKGRAGVLLTAVVPPSRQHAIEHLIFKHTSTIGIRRYRADRDKLKREQRGLNTSLGAVAVKVVTLADGSQRMTIEYEDAKDLAGKTNRTLQEVRRAAEDAWAQQTSDA